MHRSVRRMAAAAASVTAAVVIPISLATPANAAGAGDIPPPNVMETVKTVQQYYCGWDFTPFCW